MTTLRVALREFADFENALAAEIAQYRGVRPEVSVEAVAMELPALYRELYTSGGLRSGKWDLGLLVTDWLPEFVEAGALEELTGPIATFPEWPEGWPRSLREPLEFGGRTYSIPWHDGPECLIWRSDLFESREEQAAFRARFGYALAPPRTWRQFEDVARFFTRPERGLYGTLFAAYPDGHNTLYDFALQVWSRGGELQDGAGRPTLATPAAVAGLDFYRRLVRDAGMCHPRSRELDSVESGDVFLSGSVAMMVNWFGFAARSQRAGSPLEGRVALAPIPCDEGLKPVSLSVFWTMGVGSGSKEKEAAVDFLRFLARAEMDREIVRHGAVGVRLSTWRDAEVQRTIPAYREIEEISMGARRLPRTAALPAFAEIVNEIVERALGSEEASGTILERAQRRGVAEGIRFA